MYQKFRGHFFPLSFKNSLFFCFLWLFIGFAVGTALLIGPVEEVTSFFRQQGINQTYEDLTVNLIIFVYVILTFLATLYLTRFAHQSHYRHVSFSIMIVAFLSAASAVYLWMNPAVMNQNQAVSVSTNSQFTFGPYPTEKRLQKLEEEGYTTVVSLLHPAVIPFEPKLLQEQKEMIKKTELEFVHLPMLPWVSDNTESLSRLRELAQTGNGKYYVHCYLGKDRVATAQRIVESANNNIKVQRSNDLTARKKIPSVDTLTRGPVTRLANEVYITPYPTDDEFVRNIFGWDVQGIISLMNPENSQDSSWINKERELLKNHFINFTNAPISSTVYEPNDVLEIVRSVKARQKPVMVHGFLTPSFRSQAFIQAYRTDLPPLPDMWFPLSLTNGDATLIASNVLAGPSPTGPEFGGRLIPKGIRGFIYLGNSEDSTASDHQSIAQNYQIKWQSYFIEEQEISSLLDTLRHGGPWYLYGPELNAAQNVLSAQLGPVLPDTMRVEAKLANTEEEWQTIRLINIFMDEAVPNQKMVILLTPVLLLYIIFSAFFAGYLRTQKDVATAYTRKIFHVFIFVMAAILQFMIGLPAVIIFGSITSLAVIYAIYRGEGFPYYEAMARPSDQPRRSFFILVPLITTALGGLTANIFFMQYAYIGYLVTGLGDAVGEPVGKRWGNHRYQVPSLAGVPATRSLEGSAAIFLVSICMAFLGLWIGGIALPTAIGVAIACGSAAALVEAISNHGLDNFTIQVAAAAVVYFLLS